MAVLPTLRGVPLTLIGCVCFLAHLATPMPLPTDTPTCTAAESGHYGLTFTGKWTQSAFPKQYPIYRPPAQWSTLIGVSHSADYHMWRRGDFASNGLREFTEKAEAWTLMKEVEAAGQRAHGALGVFSAPAMTSGSGQAGAEFQVSASSSFVSFTVRIVPSPDWFVGVDSLDLCEGDQWKENVTLELFPYDAGTDSGFTFSSPNYETIPQEKVTQITSAFPNHPANSFFYPRVKHLPPLAKVTLTKIKKTNQIVSLPAEPTQSNQLPTDNEIEERLIETPLDCEVSPWSPWGLCKGKCGDSGVKHRTRYVLLHSANHGTACPLLDEEKKCTPDNCL